MKAHPYKKDCSCEVCKEIKKSYDEARHYVVPESDPFEDDLLPKRIVQVTPIDEVSSVVNGPREKTHGDFSFNAIVSQELKRTMRGSENWEKLGSPQKESLELIATKIGRILSGDPHHRDSWLDIQGYAKLVTDRLPKP